MFDGVKEDDGRLIVGSRSSVGGGASTSKHTMWFLSGRVLPNEPVRHVPLHSTPFLVGRSPKATLCLPNKTVSTIHAELIDTGTQLVLRDVGSTNGTYINGRRVVGSVELKPDDLIQFADIAFRVVKQSASLNPATVYEDVYDQAMALVQLDRLMNEEAVIPHYQSIVDLHTGDTIGFEALARSRVAGLETPGAMFSAAAQLNLQVQLSQMIRFKAIHQTCHFDDPPHLFVNTHPAELDEPGLIESMKAVRELSPRQPITLEIHEAAFTTPGAMKELRAALSDLNIGLAFDDFGAGQTRLRELSEVNPEYLKFDMSLIRSIDNSSTGHVQMVASLVRMVKELGVIALAEGIETAEERDVCVQIGFELAQGFYYGQPMSLSSYIFDSVPVA